LTEQITPRDDAGRFTGVDPFTESVGTEVTDAMARAVDKGDRPSDAFKPMEMATPEPPKEDTFSDSVDDLKAAAAELQERRQQNRAAPTPRIYQDLKTREPRPPTETRKLSEAATDLKDLRNAEADLAIAHSNQDLAQKIDQFRAERDAQEVLAEHYAKQQPEAPTPQPESAPETAPADGVHPDIRAALTNPVVREALNQVVQQSEGARQQSEAARAQYVGAVQQLGNATWASIVAQFPEMQQGSPQQVLEQMRMQNPQRFAEIVGHLSKVQQIGQHWQQLQAQQQQQQAREFSQFSAQADAEYDSYVATRPAAERKQVMDNLEGMFRAYGIDKQEFVKLYQSSPLLRSGAAQIMFHDLAVFHAAKQAASQRAAAPVPKVVRPGEAYDRPSGEAAVVTEKMRQFAADPNPRNAAKALAARRRAASVLR
jgi:hypothetical protein